MSNPLSVGITWVLAHPTRKNVPNAKYRIGYGWSWSQLCVALVFWAIGATRSWDTANLARAHSTIVSKDRNPPDGAIGWFLLGKDGHVGFFKGGVMYSATKWASNLGSALGTLTIAEYERLSGATWIGWGWDFGGQTFAGISTAGTGNVIPLTDPNLENEMKLVLDPTAKNADGSNLYWVIGNGAPYKLVGVQQAANDFNALQGLTTTVTPTKAQFPVFMAQCTPPATAGGTSLQPVLDAIASLSKLETADQAALVTALSALPAAVRAKIVAAP